MLTLVADGHILARQGLLALLRGGHPEWSFCEASSFDEILQRLAAAQVELAIIDLLTPGMDCGASLAILRRTYQRLKIVVLAAREDRETILECLAAGVHGYVLTSEAPAQLSWAIDLILGGGVYVPGSLARLGAAPHPAPRPTGTADLTARQHDVLLLLAQGYPTKAIARRLDLGLGTVKVHLAEIYRRLGARNRVEALVKAGRFLPRN